MSKAHQAILDSLRQETYGQAYGVQTEEIQSFGICVIFAEMMASQSCHRELAQLPSSVPQSKLQRNTLRPYPHPLPGQARLCAKGKSVLEIGSLLL